MADFGLSRAIRQAVLSGVKTGAKEAKVLRPGELESAVKPKLDAPAAVAPDVPPLATTQSDPGLATPAAAPTAVPQSIPEGAVPLDTTVQQSLDSRPLDVDAHANRVAGLKLENYDLDAIEQPNFDKIATTDQVKSVIADVSARNAGAINEARRGVITNNQLSYLAADLDVNEDIVRKVMERESGGILNAETILGARQVLNSSADRIQQLGTKIAADGGTQMERIQFRRQLLWHQDYQTQFMGARAEAGRALNAFNIPSKVNAFTLDIIENMNGHDTDKLAKEVALTDSTQAVTQLSRKYTQSKLMGTINELFINSMLSGPKTHIVNASGNVLMQSMNIAETAVAARIGRFLGGEEHVAVGEASALAHGTISAWRDGFRLAAKTARTGIALDDVVKFDSSPRRSISASNLMTPEQRATPLGRFAEALIDGVRVPSKNPNFPNGIPVPGIGPIVRAPTERIMMPTDEFFKTLAYRGELERQAFLHAHDQVLSGAADAADAAQIAREFMESAPLKAVDAAEEYTRYVTFQNDLGDVGQKFQLALRSTPWLTLIAPFVRTPINLFKAGIIDRSPLGMFSKKFWSTMKAGGRERDMMLARVGMGTATTSVVASYVMSGDITGGGPQSPQARDVLTASGWRPYSIRVTDPTTGEQSYVSYSRMEPLAFVIGATADATEILSYINSDAEEMVGEEESAVWNAAAAVITGVANNTMSKTFVRGVSDFTEMMSDPKRYFRGWAANQVTTVIPFASLRNQLGQIQDPYLREAWTVLDQLKVHSGIPGYSELAPPRRDILGQPRMAPAGSLLGPMSPFPVSQVDTDPVLSELTRVMNSTKTVPVNMPSKRIEGMKLTADEYDDLTVYSRLDVAPNGRTFRDELERAMGSSVYEKATVDMQSELLKSVQKNYDAIAAIRLEKENPGFAERITRYRAQKDQRRFGL